MDKPNDLAYDIIKERLEFAVNLVKEIADKNTISLTDAELMENARNLAISMFIQKESGRRMKK